MHKNRTLVTPALPYANGAIHLGHLVEHIQVNTYVRALRMFGEDVLYVCGADTHGTAVEVNAQKAGVTPEAFAAQWQEAHGKSLARFHIEFDGGYGTTHTPENQKHAGRIYQALKDGGHVFKRSVEQLQDPTDGRFLSDRFVKGTCPSCGTADQYGDSCEACGSTYRPTELKNPYSVITKATPVLGKSDHVFVKLADFGDKLRAYLKTPGVLDESQQNFLDGWLTDLKDWDVSRDGPYFGFPIPGEDNKYFYVWLDAPVGYISLAERASGGEWEKYFKDPHTRIEHFIGKDILYFHTLFWPAMLMASGDTLPSAVHVHGMLTIDGTKMSKSRGTFINADDFADVVNPEALRYYFAAKLTAAPQDIDLSFTDFVNRVNADLVNNVINLLSRTVPQLHKVSAGLPCPMDEHAAVLIEDIEHMGITVAAKYKGLDFAEALRTVVAMADRGNKYLQEKAPWDVARTDPERARAILSTSLWVGKCCIALLKPVLPVVAEKVERMLACAPFTFDNALQPLRLDRAILPYERLFERLELDKVQVLVKPTEAPMTTSAPAVKADKKPKPEAKKPVDDTPPAEIAFDAFAAVDLRAAKIVEATAVVGSDKLIHVHADLGALGIREIFTGLRPHVQPEQLQGRTVVVVANLAPRKMAKFGMSHGMILAAGEIPQPLFVDGATPGDRVR